MNEPTEPTLENLIREVEEARFSEAVFQATGEEVLDRARDISQRIEKKVKKALHDRPGKAPPADPSGDDLRELRQAAVTIRPRPYPAPAL